jgi:hypothetical protein
LRKPPRYYSNHSPPSIKLVTLFLPQIPDSQMKIHSMRKSMWLGISRKTPPENLQITVIYLFIYLFILAIQFCHDRGSTFHLWAVSKGLLIKKLAKYSLYDSHQFAGNKFFLCDSDYFTVGCPLVCWQRILPWPTSTTRMLFSIYRGLRRTHYSSIMASSMVSVLKKKIKLKIPHRNLKYTKTF